MPRAWSSAGSPRSSPCACAASTRPTLHAPRRLRRQRHRHQRRQGEVHRPQARPEALSTTTPAIRAASRSARRKFILEGRFPERVVEKAVERMLPRGPLVRQQHAATSASTGHRASARGPAARDARRRRDQPQEREAPDHGRTFSPSPTSTGANTASRRERAPVHVQKLDAQGRAYATGKRKDAVARVWIKPGSGKITVNGRESTVYFARPVLRMILHQPLDVAQPRRPVRHDRHGRGRRSVGPGRRGAPRHLEGADLLRAGAARRRSRRAAS